MGGRRWDAPKKLLSSHERVEPATSKIQTSLDSFTEPIVRGWENTKKTFWQLYKDICHYLKDSFLQGTINLVDLAELIFKYTGVYLDFADYYPRNKTNQHFLQMTRSDGVIIEMSLDTLYKKCERWLDLEIEHGALTDMKGYKRAWNPWYRNEYHLCLKRLLEMIIARMEGKMLKDDIFRDEFDKTFAGKVDSFRRVEDFSYKFVKRKGGIYISYSALKYFKTVLGIIVCIKVGWKVKAIQRICALINRAGGSNERKARKLWLLSAKICRRVLSLKKIQNFDTRCIM